MSAIAGFIRFDGAPLQHDLVNTMTDVMAYRGPDGIGHWRSDTAALGHCLLQTTPESLCERQPLASEDGSLVVVMDGRVDNRADLRAELRRSGAVLRDESDAEVVLRAFQRWETDTARRLEGDFAFVVWDERQRRAYLARDRMGNKPFYYWRSAGFLAFATDFAALLALPGSPRAINEAMLAEHLAVDIRCLDETLITDIRRLPPARYQLVTATGQREHPYWDIDCTAQIRYRDDRDYVAHFRELLRTVVAQQLRSNTGVGIYLSGGVDSSTIAGVAASVAPARTAVEGYSVRYPGMACDETPYIQQVLQHCGINGNFVDDRPRPFAEVRATIQQSLDLPDGPNGAAVSDLRAMARQRGLRVMLDGYGGDEWFERSPTYYSHLMRSLQVTALAHQLRYDLKRGAAVSDLAAELLYGGLIPILPARLRAALRTLRRGGRWLTGAADPGHPLVSAQLAAAVALPERLRRPVACARTRDPCHFARHQILHYGWNVRGQEIGNRIAARFEVEERSPFNDRRIVEFAFALPESQRSQGSGKYLLRKVAQGFIPESVRCRSDKAEFSSTVADAVRRGERPDALPKSALVAAGYVDGDALRRCCDAFYRNGDADAVARDCTGDEWPLWMVMILEDWVSTLAPCNGV